MKGACDIISLMRYMGIDYGKKRVGIAVSDENGRMAFPKTTIFNTGVAVVVKKIVTLCKQEHVERVVVGLPFNLDGTETEQTILTRKFARALEKSLPYPVEFEDEMLTSRVARGSGMKGGHVDAAAAALMLQSYLDKKSRADETRLFPSKPS